MKVGLNTMIFRATFTDKDYEIFAPIRDMGFDGVEIGLEKKGDIDYDRCRKELEKNGLENSSVCGLFGEDRDIRGPNKEHIETGKAYIKDLIDAASELGSGLVSGPLYSAVGRANFETDEAKKEQWKTVRENFKELAEYAKGKNVRLSIEPLNRFETDFINIAADARRMVDEVGYDNFGIHLDTFHMNVEEKSSADAVRLAGDKLFMLHTCENDRGAAGTGQVHWDEIAKAVKDIGYDYYCVIEAFTPDMEVIAKAASVWRYTEPNAETLAKKAVDFLKKTFV
ncbi:MAG: sugar phosphate isomerase/epimerase [Spirochaetales bacterium]|nr:sugar phosphate isomerase/epimerase [Spirochaetales bacterium]MCF7937960.1 sugar phosphate isomerase/epimerase [Spirochaetales bacterium]